MMLSVGDLLKKQRIEKNITLQQAEKETKMRLKYLQAVEENNWEIFSSKVYITGVIKNYAKYLGMDPKKTAAYFRRDYEKKEELKFKKRVSSTYFHTETKKIVIGIFAVIFLIFFVYFGYQLKIYLSPPSITITAPTKTVFRNTEKIKVVGKTDKEASIMVFGNRIYANKEGIFEYDLPLKKGKNSITIEVTGANGKKSSLKQEFILE